MGYQLPAENEYYEKYALEKVLIYSESDDETANIPSVDKRSDRKIERITQHK